MSKNSTAYALISPALVTVILALSVCLGVMLTSSFWSQSYLTIERDFTLENYETIFDKRLFEILFSRTLWISTLVTVVSLLIAFPMAYFVAFDIRRNKIAWLVFLTLPCWISYLLRILSWKLILGYDGIVNSSLIFFGVIEEALGFLLYNSTAVTIALTHAWAPFALLPIYVSLEKIDRSLLQASTDLGDSPLATFFRVTLPLSMPGVSAAALLIFIPTFGDYVTPAMIGGTSGSMIGNFIASQFGASNNWPLGAAVAVVSMLAATAVALLSLGVAHAATRAIK